MVSMCNLESLPKTTSCESQLWKPFGKLIPIINPTVPKGITCNISYISCFLLSFPYCFSQQKKNGWWFQPLWNILVSWDDDIPNIWKNKTCSKPPTRSYGFPMVFLWFSYGFPMAFPDSPRRIPLRAQTDKLSRLRRCRFDAKVITDLEHLAARKGGARSMGHFPNCPVSLPEAIGKIPTYNHDYIIIIYMIIIFPIIYYNYTWLYMFFASASINKIEM